MTLKKLEFTPDSGTVDTYGEGNVKLPVIIIIIYIIKCKIHRNGAPNCNVHTL